MTTSCVSRMNFIVKFNNLTYLERTDILYSDTVATPVKYLFSCSTVIISFPYMVREDKNLHFISLADQWMGLGIFRYWVLFPLRVVISTILRW